jgi:predicted ArsR family transcriptional regulator
MTGVPTLSDPERRIASLAALDQPLRRALYQHLATADGWTSRDEAAAALGIARSVAAFHLDKLADAGVVEVRFERTSGRQGPGAGRPAKLYRPGRDEISASIPDRRYDLAGSLLARAVAESSRTGTPVRDCLRAAAHAAGLRIGEAEGEAGEEAGETGEEAGGSSAPADERPRTVVDVLARHGYEPTAGPDEITLANCPFHRLAEENRELVCGMNLDFLEGLLDGLRPSRGLTARLDPAPGRCCVRIAA